MRSESRMKRWWSLRLDGDGAIERAVATEMQSRVVRETQQKGVIESSVGCDWGWSGWSKQASNPKWIRVAGAAEADKGTARERETQRGSEPDGKRSTRELGPSGRGRGCGGDPMRQGMQCGAKAIPTQRLTIATVKAKQ